ncbi:biotin transporter BioY [Alsobacter metallidurans]|uniref:Biotin transporter n=1 Tax=Alsobacter metallidurans TaxID=340221 RepID=A0A917MGQ2_9HYPH|nr:biotin transporter BioY [Alsobacter metallidurans]GGH12352.1 biotin transporter BioY [Alsobacter metallidurans]
MAAESLPTPMPTTLASALWPAASAGSDRAATLARAVFLALVGTALLTLSAKIKVPFYPVPMTLQTLVVLWLGAAYGSRLAAVTVIAYLVEGALGLPVFADTPERGIGLAYMMGPTGGYLLGFVAGAFLVGVLCERGLGRSLLGMGVAMTLGHLAIFAFGFGWLAMAIGAEKAWLAGVVPFFAATALKTALGAALVPAVWTVVDKRRG